MQNDLVNLVEGITPYTRAGTVVLDSVSTNEIKKKELSILNLNICSLQKNIDEVQILLKQFTLQHDILVFTETFILNSEKLNIENYIFHYNKALFNRNDGTVVYLHKNIEVGKVETIKINEVTFLVLNLKKKTK